MTRRELIATTVAVPLAPMTALRCAPAAPWMRVTVTCCDTGHTETTWYSDIEAYHVADLWDGDTLAVETSKHVCIEYRHSGPPGAATYNPVHEAIFGPPIRSDI